MHSVGPETNLLSTDGTLTAILFVSIRHSKKVVVPLLIKLKSTACMASSQLGSFTTQHLTGG